MSTFWEVPPSEHTEEQGLTLHLPIHSLVLGSILVSFFRVQAVSSDHFGFCFVFAIESGHIY